MVTGAVFGLGPAIRNDTMRMTNSTLAALNDLSSFQTALQDQFGLKLETTRGPVEVMVIDSVRQPTKT